MDKRDPDDYKSTPTNTHFFNAKSTPTHTQLDKCDTPLNNDHLGTQVYAYIKQIWFVSSGL